MNEKDILPLNSARSQRQRKQQQHRQQAQEFIDDKNQIVLDAPKHLNVEVVKLNTKPTTKIKTVPSTPIIINNVDILPSLEFVLKIPRHHIIEQQSGAVRCLLSENSLNNSHLTYTINSYSSLELCNKVEQKDRYYYLQQQQQDSDILTRQINEGDLNDITGSKFLVEVMEGEDASSKLTNDDEKVDATKVQNCDIKSDEESIEEDIEIEEVIAVSKSSNHSQNSSLCIDQSKVESLKNLFNLDLSCFADSSSNTYQLSKNSNKSKENIKISLEEEGQFKIDDDQLSGGKLAQHFLLEDEDEQTISNNHDIHKSNLLPAQKIGSIEHDPDLSLNNQSTTDDVSDLMEEENTKNDDLSELNLARNMDVAENNGEHFKDVISDTLPCPPRRETRNIRPFSDVSSMYEQKDNSVDEIIIKDQSVSHSSEVEKQLIHSEHLCLQKGPSNVLVDSSEDKENQLHAPDISNKSKKQSNFLEQKGQQIVEKITKDFAFIFPKAISDSALYSSSKQDNTLKKKIYGETNQKLVKPSDGSISNIEMITDLDNTSVTQMGQNIEINVIDNTENEQKDSIPVVNLEISENCEEDEEETSMNLMKMRLFAMRHQTKEMSSPLTDIETSISVKSMERSSIVELANDILEDITEESEKNSLTSNNNNNIIKNTNKNNGTSDTLINGNDVPPVFLEPSNTSALNVNSIQKMEKKFDELETTKATKDKDSNSLTHSTEYRTFHEDIGAATTDIYIELSKRDELIARLMQSLQKSVADRENLQIESEKLNGEVVMLRKQLTERMENTRSRGGSRDQESNGGQRLSEISMELVSESEDDADRDDLTFNDNYKCARDVRDGDIDVATDSSAIFTKQMEQYQKCLTPSEARIFFMVQKKFHDYLSQELEKNKMKLGQEYKIIIDQCEKEKREQQEEIQKLLDLKLDIDKKHKREMEDLRKYFEYKCADLEKQFSDDVFSQKSQRHSLSSSSETLDRDEMSNDNKFITSSSQTQQLKKSTPSSLLNIPSYRQITFGNHNFCLENENQEQITKKFDQHVKIFEDRYGESEFLSPSSSLKQYTGPDSQNNRKEEKEKKEYNVNDKVSLILIDQDELINHHNDEDNVNAVTMDQETDIIRKIVEEYEKRLHEQLTLAKEDIARELEQQIQSVLSESNTDDQHWPKELILLREKFTAESQLEIAQLQIKHADEMSRLKLEYEKQLNRKNKRHLTFDSIRDFDRLLDERDSLRELTKSLRHVLAQLAKFVMNYDKGLLDNSLINNVQYLLRCNKSHNGEENDINTTNDNILNTSNSHLMPDVQGLLQIIEDPSLVEYIANKTHDISEDFDLKNCLEKLNDEAACLLHLSENLAKSKQPQQLTEREDDDIENFVGLKCNEKCMNSLNEQELPTYHEVNKHSRARFHYNSLSPNFNRHRNVHSVEDGGSNSSELNCQLIELKNCLIKSESDRTKLQKELEHTIKRNAELGAELQQHQLSQLNSLNTHNDNGEYCLSPSMKGSPCRCGSAVGNLNDNMIRNYNQLQEKLRNILLTPKQKPTTITSEAPATTATADDTSLLLLQMVEDFCREGDKVLECNKKDKEDLKSQIDIADKQLKATRQFLEEQAIEREHERDEFLREIDKLKNQLNDKEKECSNYVKTSREIEYLDAQIRELNQKLKDSNQKCDKFEMELKASIDKIFVLREIISDLETQVETKDLNEHVVTEKLKELKNYINTQNEANDRLEKKVQILTNDIEQVYKTKIKQMNEKLQNMRPTAEQNMLLDQVIDQLHEIEIIIEQKTKQLEMLHDQTAAYGSNSGSLCATEDVSAAVPGPAISKSDGASVVNSPGQSSPEHPSPRQHCLTIASVQRLMDKLSKHTRVEEAAVKRTQDLEMHIAQIKQFYMELQNEREALQERMSEQTQRIMVLQNRLEEQRQRAEELQRFNNSGLNIRIHDLQNEIENLKEKLSIRDKQIATQSKQLDESKQAIDRLEAELEVNHEPDRSLVERLENELKQKQSENQRLKEKIKTEMINKLALPDLMETVLADKNEEIDHLREQLDNKERELKSITDTSGDSSLGLKKTTAKPDDSVPGGGAKLSARTLSDIVSISDYDEPDVLRRLAIQNSCSPFVLPVDGVGIGHSTQQSMEMSKTCAINLTYKRSENLVGIPNEKGHVNTFDNPHYFQDPNLLMNSGQSCSSNTPYIAPRQINFSGLTEDSKLKTPSTALDNKQQQQINQENNTKLLKEQLKLAINESATIKQEKEKINMELLAVQVRLNNLQNDLALCYKEMKELREENEEKKEQIAKLTEENRELLSKNEKDLNNYKAMEEMYKSRLKDMEGNILKNIEREMQERESLRKELKNVEEIHKNCKYVEQENEKHREEVNILHQDGKIKDEKISMIKTKLSLSEEYVAELKQNIIILEGEIEKLKQHNSDNSSKHFSVDEIAKRVEKELNYSALLDSNILKAIESEEENNFDGNHVRKNRRNVVEITPGTTDDENFIGERDLLNQLEVMKTQIIVEREQNEEVRQELVQVKQHSQDIQEQDFLIIEAMRKRLEAILEEENDLHKKLDVERERCERLRTQLAALQRLESRRNSSLQKSPTESPRKSPRSLTGDFESELIERLQSEIKLLSAQNERERERSADLQMTGERERARFEKELKERVEYCDKLKREMDKLARDKENTELTIDHLQERLTLQTQEIESLESRITALQEAEARRQACKDRQFKENAQLMIEIKDLKEQLSNVVMEKEALNKCIVQLRCDIEHLSKKELTLTEALACTNSVNCMHQQQRDTCQIIPNEFLQKMKEINDLLAENTQENKQMTDTIQCLVEERRQLQRKCEKLEAQLCGHADVNELEERCHHLLARYLRVESHRKALVYQKRYLKISLQGYLDNEQRALAVYNKDLGLIHNGQNKRKLFKIVALAIISIQRMKYIGRSWQTGKRIVSKSIFTITRQRHQPQPQPQHHPQQQPQRSPINCAAVSSTPMSTTRADANYGSRSSATCYSTNVMPHLAPLGNDR